MIGAPVPPTLLVIDIDPRNGGDLDDLQDVLGPLPVTTNVMSGREDGGRHLYYRRPAGQLTSSRLPDGIDLKLSGYCIVPPSIHPATGQPYRWTSDPVVHLTPRAIAALRPPVRPTRVTVWPPQRASAEALIRTVCQAAEGRRNDLTFWAAKCAISQGYDETVLEAIQDAAIAAGLPTRDVARTIASARRNTLAGGS